MPFIITCSARVKEEILSWVLFFQGTTATTSPSPSEGNWQASTFMVAVVFVILIVAVAALAIVNLRRPGAGVPSKSWLDYGNFFIVALGILAVLVAFLSALLFALDQEVPLFTDSTELLAVLVAVFGIIGTLVGTYFGVKASSDAADGAQNLVGSTITSNTTRPAVTSVSPLPNAASVDRNTQVTATFSKDMNPTTLTSHYFTLVQRDPPNTRVAGTVVYDQAAKRATFVPTVTLEPTTAYRATITTDVQDQAGNALPVAHTWDFTTGA
jgi:Bacterial Ig-like domain